MECVAVRHVVMKTVVVFYETGQVGFGDAGSMMVG